MDFTKALTYPFDDPEWITKLGIAVGVTILMFIVPVIGTILGALLLAGWSYETSKNVRNGVPNPMASWSEFGALLSRGLQLAIAGIVYQIPTLIFACIATFVWVLPAMGGSEDAAAGLAGIASIIAICCSCVIFLYALAAGLVYTAGYIRYMDNESLGTFFQFGDNIALFRENIGDFGMAFVFMILGGLIAGVLSGTGIGALIGQAFTNYFNAHIVGQLATKLRGGTMMPLG
jgi:hypothetical protein